MAAISSDAQGLAVRVRSTPARGVPPVVRLEGFWHALQGELSRVQGAEGQGGPPQRGELGRSLPRGPGQVRESPPPMCCAASDLPLLGSPGEVGAYRRCASNAVSVPGLLRFLGLCQ